MENRGWGVELGPSQARERITLLAYADDMTVFASSRIQASKIFSEMSAALEGINLRLLPEKCSALWSETPAGTETAKINLGTENIPIVGALVVLGQEISFKKTQCTHFNTGSGKHGKQHTPMQSSSEAQRCHTEPGSGCCKH